MKKIFLITILLSLLVNFNFVFAQDAGSQKNTFDAGSQKNTQTINQPIVPLQNPLNAKSVKDLIFLVVDIMIYIGIIFATLAIIFVGFKFVLAQGNSEKLKEAREWFLYIIIGLAILISSKVIVEIIQNTLIKSGVVNERAFTP